MTDPARQTRVTVENIVEQDASRWLDASAVQTLGHEEAWQSAAGLKLEPGSTDTDMAHSKKIDRRAYDTIENLLPLTFAIIAIGIKLWLYW